MAYNERSLDDYVDVAQRLAEFRAAHPEGSLQPADPAMPYHVVRVPATWCRRCIGRQVVKDDAAWKRCPRCSGTGLRAEGEPHEDVFIVYYAAAYRTPDDPRPGIGAAWEPYPGQTPYTAGSELMNAETSAWGRAIVAALAGDSKKGVASRQEVKARRAEREDPAVRPRVTGAEHERLRNGTVEPVPEDRRAQRGPLGTGDDKWAGQPAGSLPVNPEDKPGSVSRPQSRAMHAAFGQLGITGRDDRLAVTAQITGRAVGTSSDLSYAEADGLLRELAARLAAKRKEESG